MKARTLATARVASGRRIRPKSRAKGPTEMMSALSARDAFFFALGQEREGRPTRRTQVRPRFDRRDNDVTADGEPVGLVCLSVHDKNVGMLLTHDLKAHASLPSHRTRTGSVPTSR